MISRNSLFMKYSNFATTMDKKKKRKETTASPSRITTVVMTTTTKKYHTQRERDTMFKLWNRYGQYEKTNYNRFLSRSDGIIRKQKQTNRNVKKKSRAAVQERLYIEQQLARIMYLIRLLHYRFIHSERVYLLFCKYF